ESAERDPIPLSVFSVASCESIPERAVADPAAVCSSSPPLARHRDSHADAARLIRFRTAVRDAEPELAGLPKQNYSLRMVTAPPLPKVAARRLLTSEEFLQWLQPGVFADLIGGEIVMHSPVTIRHARLINFLDCCAPISKRRILANCTVSPSPSASACARRSC